MAKFIPLMTWLLLSALFIVSLLTFATIFQSDNQTAIAHESDLLNDSRLAELTSSLTTSLTSAKSDFKNAQNSTEQSEIESGNSNPFFKSVGGIWKTIKTAPTSIWNTISLFLNDVLFFGDENRLAYYTAGAILTLIIIGSVIYLVTRGEA